MEFLLTFWLIFVLFCVGFNTVHNALKRNSRPDFNPRPYSPRRY